MAAKKLKPSDLKIVVIDDSDFSRSTIVEILESENYKVVGQCNNVDDAIKYVGSGMANVFIIDIVMPQSSGIELAKMIRDTRLDLYTILMTSLNMEHLQVEAINAGAIDFIPKPFTKFEILQSLEKLKKHIESEH